MLLHVFAITPNNRKVTAFIKHFGLDVDIHQVSVKDKEHKSPEFLKMNPMGRIPVLDDDGFYLPEGNAILTYLARKFPETNMLPDDIEGLAQVERWLHWQSSHLMPTMVALRTGDEQRFGKIEDLVDVLNGQLEGQDYVLGELSVIDFALGAFFMTKNMRDYDYSAAPNTGAWLKRLEGLKGFQQTEHKGGPPPGT